MFNSFEELVSAAVNGSNTDEKERIRREIAVIEERDWKDYTVFLANVISECKTVGHFLAFFGGSAVDSYLIWKAWHPEEVNSNLLKPNPLAVFENDMLRLKVDVVSIDMNFNRKTLEILDGAIERSLKLLGLKKWEIQLPTPKMVGTGVMAEMMIVSRKELSMDDKIVFLAEKTESTDKEADVLRGCVKIVINVGIGL